LSEIKALVDEYAKWDRLLAEGKIETDKVKTKIQKNAMSDLENAKSKQVKYWGTDSNCATATATESVKLISYEYLKYMIPEKVLNEFVKPDTVYKMSDTFKKIIAPLCQGSYIEQRVSDVIKQMPLEPDKVKLAAKKLKGNWEKDKAFLMSLGLNDEDAEYWAFFVAEAAAWERIVYFLEVAGYVEGTEGFQIALQSLRNAVIVEENLKVGIEYDKEGESL